MHILNEKGKKKYKHLKVKGLLKLEQLRLITPSKKNIYDCL